MGLDMYLNRMPRYKDATANDVNAVENYLDLIAAKEEGSEYANCTFERWCGIKEEPCEDFLKFYGSYNSKKYSYMDAVKKFGYDRVIEEIGYWRKENAIHLWFIKNVQDGEDDCEYHREVTKEDLEELREVCECVLMKPELAESLLPTTEGFFFGSTKYDEWYIQGLKHTIEICDQALATTDFDKQMIYYVSSW